MDVTLITAGIACIMAAIVGGGLKAFAIEIPVLASPRRQLALGAFGVLLVAAGLQQRGFFGSADQSAPDVATAGEPATTATPTPIGGTTTASESCRPEWFGATPPDRVTVIESGASAVELVSASEPKDPPIVVVVAEDRMPVGAVAFRFFTANNLFKISEVVDVNCRPLDTFRNESRGGDRHVLQNYDTVELTFGARKYTLRLGYGDGAVSAALTRIGPAEQASVSPAECRGWFGSPPPNRVTVIESGVSDAELLSADKPKDAPVVVVVAENGRPVGAVAFKFYTSNDLFKIVQVVNARCEPLDTFRNETRNGDRRVIHNYDTVELTFGAVKYALRLGYGSGTIEGRLNRL